MHIAYELVTINIGAVDAGQDKAALLWFDAGCWQDLDNIWIEMSEERFAPCHTLVLCYANVQLVMPIHVQGVPMQ